MAIKKRTNEKQTGSKAIVTIEKDFVTFSIDRETSVGACVRLHKFDAHKVTVLPSFTHTYITLSHFLTHVHARKLRRLARRSVQLQVYTHTQD